MENYKGFCADQYGSVYERTSEGSIFVGKLNGETLQEWVDDYLEGIASGVYR